MKHYRCRAVKSLLSYIILYCIIVLLLYFLNWFSYFVISYFLFRHFLILILYFLIFLFFATGVTVAVSVHEYSFFVNANVLYCCSAMAAIDRSWQTNFNSITKKKIKRKKKKEKVFPYYSFPYFFKIPLLVC